MTWCGGHNIFEGSWNEQKHFDLFYLKYAYTTAHIYAYNYTGAGHMALDQCSITKIVPHATLMHLNKCAYLQIIFESFC